ncbi:DUF6177 family protein [Curtobacterium sp. Leaf261]|uniref:DUF6177 family protein n=1 Tax=Curtobacterium sp. Leaf261 TaxID=1736311 RepID=UPI0006F9E7A0|nr:DUF6177 family protein [Curtobacterium sp. Leaf261]KQO62218.1 hypothetical protein ASF23_10375 [Curtobacterium sp. Leaf261]
MSDPQQNELPAKHPLSDSEGDGSVRTESRARIVHLSSGRLDLLGKVARAGGRTILVTDGLSRITEPFRAQLEELGGRWVVRGLDELRNGLTGRHLDTFPDAIHVGPPEGVDDIALAYLRTEPPEVTQLVFSASVRHRAADETLLGGTLEVLATAIGGATPTGWGTHEPAGRPWDRAAMTAFARERMPGTSRLVATGSRDAPLAATVTVQRTDHGVEELVTGLASLGPIDANTTVDRVTALPDALTRLAAAQLPLFALLLTRPGRADLLHTALLPAPPAPVAMLIGAPAVRELGLEPARFVQEFGAVVAGRPRIPALVFPFRGSAARQVSSLGEVLRSIGVDRVAAATGMPESAHQEVRRAAQQ